MQGPDFDLDFKPAHGEAVPVAGDVQRITVNNPGPFTFHGTNTYIVGRGSVAVIDPGPEDEAHFRALMTALKGREVTHIAVSHTHRDHSPLARRLKEATGAVIFGEGPHRAARPLHEGESNPFAESSDTDFAPDIALADGERIEGDGWRLTAVATPGHTANHMAFALDGTGILFSADHVMAWATSIVAPPDGAMADYMASLDKLLAREDRLYLPGHGGPVTAPDSFVRALKAHRKMRERAVLQRLRAGDRMIPDMVKVIYASTDPRLHGAAALSVLAHIEDLIEHGRIETDGPPSLFGEFRLVL
ncbi:MBL fold metallo-hydrolase [Sinorhizobium alkalisoli]|uniref:MBL fold metallo-hydrolase n=1 Tax=Sinorhizobium alkalisoli TaxID=1752398 RepID=A0A1E3V7E5_9HYPH|nr:MBL fold metallo-hydrolase [Sinorhizobium alkalisoli]MCA1489638.1 MBL fold metallo-hydrolase [Ensifer sp. NBAIM29]MCG5478340.1 MBL fold metallo-hydrolase [Sinorhizobium alkalisoli]ODR89031.1 MBL fold metallo-hydrolase [Sinorhizobium alkalisoli]QFI65431.1 Cyclase [Sinorhizobium alkalisoli]